MRPRFLRHALITTALIAANVVVYLFEVAYPGAVLGALGERGQDIADGQYYRLLTAAFVHLPPPLVYHIVSNMMSLAIMGPVLERELGRVRFLTAYLLSALGGSALSFLLLDPAVVGIGASGAVSGVFGGIASIARRLRISPRFVVAFLALGVAISLVPGVNWAAHLGGLVTGAVLTAALYYPPRSHRVAIGAVAALVALGVVAGVVAGRTAALAGRSSGPRGSYAVTGSLAACTGYFTGCAASNNSYHATWTIRCDGDACTIGASGWASEVPLSQSGGRLLATGTRRPEYASRCRGVPIPTVDRIDVVFMPDNDGAASVQGTVRRESPYTGCKAASQTWTVTGIR
ncbi:MAG TPA: rhomboid family intramembrane serine protease [Pseudonocardia sp.]|uniref:rhomboid family intramembrane serine protease n=1 Tax=Pseudonocardia sp. TaxID=60912 RepID=UPI002F426329